MSERPTCKTCPYADNTHTWTECRIRREVRTEDGSFYIDFPTTHPDTWCGEHPAFEGYLRTLGVPDILLKPVNHLRWSVRVRRCFERAGLETLGDVCNTSEDETRYWTNFGMTSLIEVRKTLGSVGLALKGEAKLDAPAQSE